MRAGHLIITTLLSAALVNGGCRSADKDSISDEYKFDDDAYAEDLETRPEYQFCPTSTSFNVINAYWLAVASAYAYGTQKAIGKIVGRIQQKWNAKVEFLSNDPEHWYEANSQAIWIELPDFAILAFRGTQMTVQDFSTDLLLLFKMFDGNPENGSIHTGFKDGKDVIWQDIKNHILTLKGTKKPLFMTGHSLGAGLATVAAARVLLEPEFVDIARDNLSGLYTYGSPRVGDETFAKALNAAAKKYPNFHIARFRNFNDIVTRVPSLIPYLGYEHVGPLYYMDGPGRLYTKTNNLNLRRLFMPPDIAANMIEEFISYEGRDIVTKFTDHSTLKYMAKLNTEYDQHIDWVTKNNRDLCDMGLFAEPWPQEGRPAVVKPFANDLPVATSRPVGNHTVKDCCRCLRTWYYSDWGYDTRFKQENFVGVIQEGEVASGNCMYPGGKAEGHTWWQGKAKAADGKTYDQYYLYSQCEAVTLVGDRCVTGVEIFSKGKPTGKKIRTDSWVP